jgi:hypothetical protein
VREKLLYGRLKRFRATVHSRMKNIKDDRYLLTRLMPVSLELFKFEVKTIKINKGDGWSLTWTEKMVSTAEGSWIRAPAEERIGKIETVTLYGMDIDEEIVGECISGDRPFSWMYSMNPCSAPVRHRMPVMRLVEHLAPLFAGLRTSTDFTALVLHGDEMSADGLDAHWFDYCETAHITRFW